MGSYHFEMLNLGYGAYLTFREFCQQAFPGISDQTITDMVSGIDILLFRPDDEPAQAGVTRNRAVGGRGAAGQFGPCCSAEGCWLASGWRRLASCV